MAEVWGHPWLILFASFMTKFLGPSLSYVAGVFHIALVEKYSDLSLVSWLGSIFACMFTLTGPIGSFIINTFDCRTCVVLSGFLGLLGFGASFFVEDVTLLFVTYAVVAGLGTGLAQSGCMVIIGYYFDKKSSFVTGICTCGSGLGIFVHPILVRFFLDNYGLQGAFLLTGAVMFNLCVCGMLMMPSPFEREMKRVGISTTSWRKICQSMCQTCIQFPKVFKNKSFVFFTLSVFSHAIGLSTLYLHLPDYFHTQGATLIHSSFAISASGIGSIFSRILCGLAADDTSIGFDVFYACLPGILGTITVFLPYFTLSATGMVAYGFLAGLYFGATYAISNPIALEILGVQQFASGIGVVFFFNGIGFLIGPPIAASILERSGNHYNIFLYSASMFYLTTATAFISTILREKRGPRVSGRADNTQSVGQSREATEPEVEPLSPETEAKLTVS